MTWNFARAAEETGAADDRRRDGKGFMARAGHRSAEPERAIMTTPQMPAQMPEMM